ncbi:universal stress protein [Mucilaginibacter sp. SMC90]|uniref:universal stress protein n=1 Tax=Mucilaginibacter sp. SMC90 TaxID=2929803 RepID=UPI001FB339EA|nr:universal stress protein [Mucilaginibacter sp. SMC90]UOE49807.1 universal stress protein [Mucilaginibacter sp. SMC90]
MITLIVATDFSPLAENAVNYAAGLAKQFQARLIIFNAFTLSVPASNALLSAADFEDMLLDNQTRLRKKAEWITANYGIEANYESAYAMITDELENLAGKYDAGLVVLGMEPESVSQDVFGNTTTAVIKSLKCPVLAVPEGARFGGFKKVLFACDATHELPAGVLPRIKEMALLSAAEVEVFFVDQQAGERDPDEAVLASGEEIVEGLEGVACTYKKVRSASVIKGIREEIAGINADLLIMVPKTYSFWSSLTHRSKTRMMASGLNIPLLAIPA